jgi:hypothetical protein
MFVICFHCLFLLPPPTHTDFLSEYSRSSGDGFRTEKVAGKNRSDSTEQGATIANELACFFSLTTWDVVSDAASAFRTAA